VRSCKCFSIQIQIGLPHVGADELDLRRQVLPIRSKNFWSFPLVAPFANPEHRVKPA